MAADRAGVQRLLGEFRAGGRGALARAITWAEDGDARAGVLLDALAGGAARAWRTGVTGPPGAGKSTLADALCRHWSRAGRKTALLAVDPSSPLSGGALLGDRVRMDRALAETEVFVRSMASRGSVGGLARAAGEALDLLDAFGFEEVLLETVGVGQAGVEVAPAADTTLVVLTPHSGDGVQAMKAGLMEVADLLVVNKADTGGAARLQSELESSLELRPPGSPLPAVLVCSATSGQGVAEVAAAVEKRRGADAATGRLERRRHARAMARVRRLVAEELRARVWDAPGLLDEAESALGRGERPEAVARRITARFLDGPEGGAA